MKTTLIFTVALHYTYPECLIYELQFSVVTELNAVKIIALARAMILTAFNTHFQATSSPIGDDVAWK